MNIRKIGHGISLEIHRRFYFLNLGKSVLPEVINEEFSGTENQPNIIFLLTSWLRVITSNEGDGRLFLRILSYVTVTT